MKICICTTPIRPIPTTYPPFGSLAIIQSLRKMGEQPSFFHIDYHRYEQAEIEDYFSRNQFDLVGISAVVSTAYTYTKFLAALIRRVSPRTIIIIGGNLAASAEILLRKCEIDYCVTGDGEIIIQELVRVLSEHGRDLEKLRAMKGLCFLEEDGSFNFTGYGEKLSAAELEDPDYSILEADGSLDHYMEMIVDDRFLPADEEKKFVPGRGAMVVMSKGCIAKCTFCHRWEKGYRALPEEKIGNHLQYLKERYQVRYISVADENFGSDKEQATELASRMGALGLTWRAGGVRSSTVTPEGLKHWRQNGCITVSFGTESGSQTILDVMEKRISVEQNFNAIKWTYEAGMRTVLQLVMGMPGETDRTVNETIAFLKQVSDFLYLGENYPSSLISLNYAQALPGTPLYEYARQHGFIGRNVDDEERYLIKISDTDAYSEDHFVNYTGLPLLKVLMWQQKVLAEVDADYLQRKFKTRLSLYRVMEFYCQLIGSRIFAKLSRHFPWLSKMTQRVMKDGEKTELRDFTRESGYYNIREAGKFAPLLLNPISKHIFTPLLALGMAFGRTRDQSGGGLIFGYLAWAIKRALGLSSEPDLPKMSLRKVVKIHSSMPNAADDKMIPLRSGR
jgi:radical SAM superfamily enzyme YgiQ (UPF0313 family)